MLWKPRGGSQQTPARAGVKGEGAGGRRPGLPAWRQPRGCRKALPPPAPPSPLLWVGDRLGELSGVGSLPRLEEDASRMCPLGQCCPPVVQTHRILEPVPTTLALTNFRVPVLPRGPSGWDSGPKFLLSPPKLMHHNKTGKEMWPCETDCPQLLNTLASQGGGAGPREWDSDQAPHTPSDVPLRPWPR